MKELNIKSIKDIPCKKEIEELINKDAHRTLIELMHWLYVNHRQVLREWEKTQGNVSIEFLGGEK